MDYGVEKIPPPPNFKRKAAFFLCIFDNRGKAILKKIYFYNSMG
jgi:hypothetical protein